MDTSVGCKQHTDTVEKFTNSDEIWEIIDKEDDGNNIMLFLKTTEKF